MRYNPDLHPRTKKLFLAGGALASLVLLGGCSQQGDAKAATDVYTKDNNVSTSCVGNIRARLSDRNHDHERRTTADLIKVGAQACPSEDQVKVLMVANLVTDENDAKDSDNRLSDLLVYGSFTGGIIGILIYAAATEI